MSDKRAVPSRIYAARKGEQTYAALDRWKSDNVGRLPSAVGAAAACGDALVAMTFHRPSTHGLPELHLSEAEVVVDPGT